MGFRRGLKEVGYVEGQNVGIEYRWAEGQYDRLPSLARDLAGRQLAVIFAGGGVAPVLAAKAATSTIPIVFQMGSDPVKAGVVASLNRPGGNVTGVSRMSTAMLPKQLELLRELVPTASVILLLVNPTNPIAEIRLLEMQEAVHSLGIELHVLRASTEGEIDGAFELFGQIPALVIANDPFFNGRLYQIAALTARYKVPAIYSLREFALSGGLMSYNASLILLCHKLIAVNRLSAARTSVQSVDDCDDQASSHRCDRVWDVPFGPEWRSLWVGNFWERQIF